VTDHILVVGASGVLGSAMVEALAQRPDTTVHAVSRRRPDVDATFEFHSVDLEDRAACALAVASMPRISHAIYAAVTEADGLVAGWHDQAMMQRNLAMLSNILQPVTVDRGFRHLIVMQGTKAYGAHVHPVQSRHANPIRATTTRISTGCRRTGSASMPRTANGAGRSFARRSCSAARPAW